ncbi:hypothetical protein CASFOL_039279 [Castilleja foliolosa]|uniref:Uncharacterized protein n=1 Tax=Castilleja foliolosa TaxID=1961234 RepID=A0ABD3BJI5_9LAMI
MATPNLNYEENSPDFGKFKKHPNNSNLISFWAFLISIFIYITVFYAFNLSPSSLLCTPKFWFIISNTLILIIAADFSTNKNHREFYEEYHNNSLRSASNNISLYEIQYEKIGNTPKYRENEVYEELKAPEKIIVMVENKSPEIPKTSEKADKLGKKVINFRNPNRKVKIDRARVVKKREAKCVDLCNSEKLNILAGNKETDFVPKTLSERYEEYVGETTTLAENEFSRMSDEELNRRVEDFIRRFNRQIRLQAVNGSN